jgi:hypothetical protein
VIDFVLDQYLKGLERVKHRDAKVTTNIHSGVYRNSQELLSTILELSFVKHNLIYIIDFLTYAPFSI